MLLGLLTMNAVAQDSTALVPQMINYQGYLTDAAGQALRGRTEEARGRRPGRA